MRSSFSFAVATVLSIAVLLPACSSDDPVSLALAVNQTPLVACVSPGTEAIDFHAAASFGSPPYTYLWTFGDPAIPNSTEQSPSVTYPNKGSFSAQVIVTDSSGNTVDGISTSIRVKDDCNDPVATIDVPSSDVTVLLGTTVPFAGSATGGDPPYAYQWGFAPPGDGMPAGSDGENTTFQFLLEGVWTVNFWVTDNAGDGGWDHMEVTVVGSAFNVTINSPSDDESYGKDADVHCAATVTSERNEAASIAYLWSFGEGSGITDSAEQYPTVSYATPGDYTISLTVSDGDQIGNDSVDISIIDATSVHSPVAMVDAVISTPPNFGESNTPNGGAMFLGWNGASVFNAADLTFGPVILPDTNFDGGTVATPTAGPETIIFFNNTGTYISYDQGGGTFGEPVQLGVGTPKYVAMFDNDPTSDSFVLTTRERIQTYTFNAGTQTFELSAEFLPDLFVGMTSTLFAAEVRASGGEMLAASGGQTGQIWFHDGVEGNTATQVGTVGDSAKRLDLLGNICVVANEADRTCSVVTWDPSNNVAVHGVFSTGVIPRSVDLMLLGNGNFACLVSAWDFDLTSLITVAEIAPDGTIISNETFSVPQICVFPNSALWLRDGSTDILIHCQADNNVLILSSGL